MDVYAQYCLYNKSSEILTALFIVCNLDILKYVVNIFDSNIRVWRKVKNGS